MERRYALDGGDLRVREGTSVEDQLRMLIDLAGGAEDFGDWRNLYSTCGAWT